MLLLLNSTFCEGAFALIVIGDRVAKNSFSSRDSFLASTFFVLLFFGVISYVGDFSKAATKVLADIDDRRIFNDPHAPTSFKTADDQMQSVR